MVRNVKRKKNNVMNDIIYTRTFSPGKRLRNAYKPKSFRRGGNNKQKKKLYHVHKEEPRRYRFNKINNGRNVTNWPPTIADNNIFEIYRMNVIRNGER